MLRIISFSLTIFILFTGCSGSEKCCLDETSQLGLDGTNLEQNNESPALVVKSTAPQAIIKYEKDACNVGETITFDGRTSKTGTHDESIIDYSWLTDNNLIGTESNITVNCDTTGKQEICLQVTNSNDISDKKCMNYTVKEEKKTLPPVAVITIEPEADKSFWFNCAESYDQDQIVSDNNRSNNSQIVQANWLITKIKNGTEQSQTLEGCKNLVHIFDKPDLVKITLTVTDDDNETSSVTETYKCKCHHLVKQEK